MKTMRLSLEGRIQFPRLAKKRFQVRRHQLTAEYVQARVVGRKCWSVYWSGFFIE
jgi:hypothetical protein